MPLGEARLGRIGLDGSRFGRAGEHSPAPAGPAGLSKKAAVPRRGNK
jgi:hypothetical protein